MKVTRELGRVLSDTTMSSPVYLDITKEPFKLHGFYEPFRRIPKEVAGATSEGVLRNSGCSAGCRVSFRTDSDFIVVHGDIDFRGTTVTMSEVALTGFDIYFKENGKFVFKGAFGPSQGEGKNYVESRLRFDGKMHDIFLNFPIDTHFDSVYIGLREGCDLELSDGYTHKKNVVFYGSSIVQGTGASRPGTIYTSMISRDLDTDFINLGFGGNAKAEPAIMEYISTLPMSVFVYDYDHNAPDSDFLKKTHYRGYEIFRKKQPDTPVIMVSKPDYHSANKLFNSDICDNERRRRIIISDFERAVSNGDKNIAFVDGSKIYPERIRDDCTLDGCHPNDMGYRYMADAIGAEIEKFLKKDT